MLGLLKSYIGTNNSFEFPYFKLTTVKPPYSGQLSTADTFLENGWNSSQTLITKPLCNGHFIADTSIIADIILRYQSNFSPITDLFIADRRKNWSSNKNFSFLKTFLFNLYFKKRFTFRNKFFSIFIILLLIYTMLFSGP